MKIKYDVVIEGNKGKTGRKPTDEFMAIRKFVKSKHTNMVFEYADKNESLRRRMSLYTSIKRENLPIKTRVIDNRLYIIRA